MKRTLQAAAAVVLAAVLLWLFLRNTDAEALGRSLSHARPGLLSIALLVTLVHYVVRAARWKYLLAPLGRVGMWPLFATTVIGFMVNALVLSGRVGEIVRPYLLARREGLSASATLATIVLERVLDLLSVVLLVGFWLAWGTPPGGAESREALLALKTGGMMVAGASLVGLGLLAAFVHRREAALDRLRRALGWLPRRFAGPLLRFGDAFGRGVEILRDPAPLAMAVLLSVVLWLNIALALWSGARAFGLEFPFGATFLLVGFLTVGVAVPTPGAVGGYHMMYALALTLLFGADEDVAKAAALVNHAIAFFPVTLAGLLLLGWAGVSLRQLRRMDLTPGRGAGP